MVRKLLDFLILKPPIDNDIDELDRFMIPGNKSLLLTRLPYAPTYPYSKIVERIDGKQAVMRRIDGHPDLADYLWSKAGIDIPPSCRWVIRATAALAHPETNIIFAITGGTHHVSIRLRRSDLAEYPDIALIDDDGSSKYVWVKSRLDSVEDRRLLALAHSAASRDSTTT
ncbi:MAG: hypothetical protein JW818_09525 [Pirellulales bacterium]|nr:hypothetical protein [Pirellulales bacterium]